MPNQEIDTVLTALATQELASLGTLGLKRAFAKRLEVFEDRPLIQHYIQRARSDRVAEGVRMTYHRVTAQLVVTNAITAEAENQSRPFIAAFMAMIDSHVTLSGNCYRVNFDGYQQGAVVLNGLNYWAINFDLEILIETVATFVA